MKIDPTTALAAAIRMNFDLFLKVMFSEITGGTYFHNWHIDAIIHQLDRVRAGDNRRLIVTMPPRHLKSITISTAWVAWMLGHDPSLRFMCVSYGQDLAEKHARDCMKIMQSRLYRLAFPNVRLTKRSLDDFETNAGSGRLSTSIDGPITGRGAHFIIVDDPMKAGEALSDTTRERVKEGLEGSLIQRLDDQDTGVAAIIVVMQRLHEDDLAGTLIRRGGWNELRLSAIAMHDEIVPLTHGRFCRRREGCALHPARQSLATLNEKKAENWYHFAAQYQQDPVPRQGNFVQREWFQFYDDLPTSDFIVVQSWDTASQPGRANDFTVGITALYHKSRWYIIDVYRARVAFDGLRRMVTELCRRYRVDRLIIEQAGSGIQLIHMLNDEQPQGVPYPIKVKPFETKEIRFEAQASHIQSGAVLLPRSAPWLGEFIAEVVGFPNKRFDDQADALAQMLANRPWKADVTPLAGPEFYIEDRFGRIRWSSEPDFPWDEMPKSEDDGWT